MDFLKKILVCATETCHR